MDCTCKFRCNYYLCFFLLKPKEKYALPSASVAEKTSEIKKALSGTKNKKIIAVQLYKVTTTQVGTTDLPKIQYEFVHFGDDFVRDNYDINCMSRITYELDRSIVDEFSLVVRLYHEFRNTGDDYTKENLLKSVDNQINQLQKRLQSIEDESREITKEDCCIARVLTIYLSFKHILKPVQNADVSQADYIGEIELHDGDLHLSADTENQLFSQIRTGMLGAALLDTNLRHIFSYRKNGAKRGRKYCVSN